MIEGVKWSDKLLTSSFGSDEQKTTFQETVGSQFSLQFIQSISTYYFSTYIVLTPSDINHTHWWQIHFKNNQTSLC